MMTEWYRCKSWTQAEEEHFFAKLRRARKDGRAQYLRIQAFHLVESRDLTLLEVAESLLTLILSDFPDNRVEKSPTIYLLGVIHRLRGDKERALHYFKQSVEFEKEFPNVISGAHLDLAEIVVEEELADMYGEIAEILLAEIEKGRVIFPAQWYTIASVLSVISASNGESESARYYADIAERNATTSSNTLWNPKKKNLGLVEKRNALLDRKVQQGLKGS